jgi:hypothetical protein
VPKKTEPKKIEPIVVPEFIRSNTVVVLYAGTLPPPTDQVFQAFEVQGAAIGWVKTDGYMFQAMWDWVHERQRALGWPASNLIPTGYYLFIDGEIRGFQAGIIDFENDKLSLGIGVLFALGGLLTKTSGSIWAAFEIAQAQASQRVISYFTRLVETYKAHARERPPLPPPPVDELTQAFSVLGLDRSATLVTVKQRRADMIKQWHPDQFAQDPIAFGHANERLAQINAAFDLIRVRRGWN